MRSIAASLGTVLLSPLLAAELPLQFNRDIRPILSEKCIACHGPDSKHREADLRLDTAEGAYAALVEGEGFGIVPGKPEESQILARIDTDDPDEIMPPPHFHKEVTTEERAILARWIEEGAEYQVHWSYTPLVEPAIPQLTQHQNKAKNPIDNFVFARLEAEGIEPAPLASDQELIRRLSLDLTGLPPAPDAHSNPDSALESYLDSPAYGERMAVPWLDVVRFADTVGYHGDQNQRIFPYRDYVIEAFNKNLPYDQFVREQLAGDLLENPTQDQLVATGFNRLNLMSREGGVQPKEYIKKYAADRVRAVGTAFLGQTTGCAECHDHKYDPITARDFYSLAAFFDDVQQWGTYSDYAGLIKELKGFNNPSPFPPELITKSDSLAREIRYLENLSIQELAKKPLPNNGQEHVEALREFAEKHAQGWAPLLVEEYHSEKKTPMETLPEDGSVLLKGKPRKEDVLTFQLTPQSPYLGSLQIEALPDENNGGHVGRSKDGRFQLSPTVELILANGEKKPLPVRFAQADLDRPAKYVNGERASDSFGETWLSAPGPFELPSNITQQKATAVLCFQELVTLPAGAHLQVTIRSGDIGRLRFSQSPRLDPVPGQPAFTAPFLSALASGDKVNAAYHLCFSPTNKLSPHYKALLKHTRQARAGWSRTLVTNRIEKPAYPTQVLNRGDWTDETGELVAPAVLSFLPSESLPSDRKLTRLDLANWIVADENPLTARHFVNRLWKQFFGTGLSNVLDDLGGQGEPPSHPELLDWLAIEFRKSGWDVKNLVSLITSSYTYRQKAAFREELLETDPYNRLLAQQAGRRLDAEFVRDNALAVAGLLHQDLVGGASISPYQPEGHYEALNFPKREYRNSSLFYQHRRTVYAHWQRTFLHPMLGNFDAPSRDECAADRPQANSPQQALTLLNDPTFVEAAHALSKRMLAETPNGNDRDRVTHLYQHALNREPDDTEFESFQRVLAQAREKEENAGDEQKIWFHASRLILNLHETITRY